MNTISLVNLLVPAVGGVSGVPVELGLVTGTPQTIDFRSLRLDGAQFNPYGVYGIEGSAQITVDALGYTFSISAGGGRMYPAPVGSTLTLEGNGTVRLLFVNYPIF